MPLLLLALVFSASVAPASLAPDRARDLLIRLLSENEAARATAKIAISSSQDRTLLPALVEALFFASSAARPDVVACLERISGERLGARYRNWVEYVGGREEIRPKEGYRAWKAALYSRIDPAFVRFLDPAQPIRIRPEEIVWGGVRKDGIPSLRNPRTIGAESATWLDDGDTVFGIEFGGKSRAYPQRILDWHEMANDVVGGEHLALSYCTLCGSAIAYATHNPGGNSFVFGSSGLLYRSNKLMYDEQTWSLWSNLTGEPVAGPLAGRGIRLPTLPLTVTTWREWRERHPDTDVLAIETGYRRDYSPGAAYGSYFASPETMFPVWKRSDLLDAKTPVYALRVGGAARAYPLEVLFRERVTNDSVGSVPVALVADRESGAVRAYLREGHLFAEGPSPRELVEPATGMVWQVEEGQLRPAFGERLLRRLAGHRAFWFGWFAFFPETELYEGCAARSPG
jgi:hypothetical protein